MVLFQIVFAVSVIGFAYCNGQNPHSFSTSELILQTILNPRTGLFRPTVFDTTKESCPPISASTSGNGKDSHFLMFCERMRLNSVLNETIMDQICQPTTTETWNWRNCGEHLTPHIDECFDRDNNPNVKPKISRATYIWKFTEGFSDYFCENRKNFIENLIEKPTGSLVCDNKDIGREIMNCIGKQEKINPRKIHPAINKVDTELCRSYDIVQFCLNQIYRSKCTNYFQKVSEMLAQIKTAINCQNFKSPLIDEGAGKAKEKNRNMKNGETTGTKEISIMVIPILLIAQWL